jgi:choice-of-anchor C domain-containing protein
MTKTFPTVGAIVTAAIIALSLFVSAQLAFAVGTNGSFEVGTDPGLFTTLVPGDTNITDWAIGSGSVDYIGTYWVASNGARSIDMNGTAAGSISQTFPTVVGATYTVTFDLSGNPDGSPTIKEVSVSATGATPGVFQYDTSIELNSTADMKWKSKTYSFTATAANTTLTFASTIPGAFGPALDNISISDPPPVTVTIHKYVDGAHANATSAEGQSFPMQSSWNAVNIGAGSGSYSLAASTYDAQTSSMTSGADYATNEVTTGSSVGASCADGKPFALVGYSWGDSESAAATSTMSTSSPSFTGITTNKHIIVWNKDCTPKLTVTKVVTNDNGGTASITDFTLFIDNATTTSGTATTSTIGTHVVSETASSTYTATFGGDCDANGNVTLAAGDNKSCTITNNDNPPPVTVTINKYINGVQATAASANNSAFPMSATWNAANIGAGSGSYDLDADGFNGNPTPYQAITSSMTAGASYSTYEVTGGAVVGASCADGKPYALVGYKVGNDLTAAQAAPTSTTTPSFTNLLSDKVVLVLNKMCVPTPVHVSPANGSTLTTAAWDKADWTDVVDPALPITYRYESSNSSATNLDGSFVTPVYVSGPLALSEIPTPGTPAGVYYWHVRAVDNDGNMSPWTTAWQVTVDNTPPAPPANACNTPTVAPSGYTLQNGSSGSDTVTLAPFTMFVGKGGSDTVTAPAGNYIICTGKGSDTITLGHGDYTIDAGKGNNTITTGNGAGPITTGSGNDIITTGNGAHTILAGAGNNTITTGDGVQTITTLTGNDKVTTGAGADTIAVGSGNNTVTSGAGSDNITSGGGNDNLNGGADADICSAGGGSNILTSCNP